MVRKNYLESAVNGRLYTYYCDDEQRTANCVSWF